MIYDTLVQVARQVTRRLVTWRKKRAGTGNPDDLEAAATFNRMGRISYYMNDILPGTNATLRALNLSETAGPSPELATAYASVMILTGLLNFRRAARVYARLAVSVAREIGKLPTLSVILSFQCMYRLGQAEWDHVGAMAKESLDLAERLGDHHQCGEVATILAMLCCFRAEYPAATQWAARTIAAARRSGNTMHVAWALNIEGECLLRLGRLEEAVPKLEESAAALHGNKDRTEEIRIYGMRAAVAVQNGSLTQARAHADTAEAVAKQTSAVTVSTLEGFAGIAEARLAVAEAERPVATRRAAVAAMTGLRKHAKRYPTGKPRLAIYEGRLLWLKGSNAKAVRVWREGLEQARTLAMPFDEALLHQTLARHLPADSAEHREHLLAAAVLGERLGIVGEFAAVRTDQPVAKG
jgi:hypothetical protein